MLAWLGKGRKRKGRGREGQLPEGSWAWISHHCARVNRNAGRFQPNPTCDLSPFQEKVKQSCNIEEEITNQYYGHIFMKWTSLVHLKSLESYDFNFEVLHLNWFSHGQIFLSNVNTVTFSVCIYAQQKYSDHLAFHMEFLIGKNKKKWLFSLHHI